MLTLFVKSSEFYDEAKKQFITLPETTLELEHSLASLSKWEQIWEKPFLGKGDKTIEETISYIKCMSLTSNVPDLVFRHLGAENNTKVSEYIEAKMTATTFSNLLNGPPNREIITAEIIYYWMFSLAVPLEYENWHLNKLLTLIKVINLKNAPKKKMPRNSAMARQRSLNHQRRAQSGSRG